MTGNFYGQPTKTLENQHLRLEFLSESGPRLVRLFPAGSTENLLAEVPAKDFETPYGTFHLWGGHRLWHAPEHYPRTYVPDNEGLEIEELPSGVRLTGPIEAPTGLRKSIEITLHPDRPALTLRHFMSNQSLWPVELAPWAITQLPLGGLMILPQQIGPLDPQGLLPNRQIVLWPYTSLKDPRLQLNDDYVFIQAQAQVPPVKVGYLNRIGWLGYLHQNVLFCKRFEPQVDRSHVDFGCNVESYCNDEFIEMETVGPLTRLDPGVSLQHRETWEIYPAAGFESTPQRVRDLLLELKFSIR